MTIRCHICRGEVYGLPADINSVGGVIACVGCYMEAQRHALSFEPYNSGSWMRRFRGWLRAHAHESLRR